MKRCLALLLALVMLLSAWPVGVVSAEAPQEQSAAPVAEATRTPSDGAIPMTVKPAGNIIANVRSGGWNKGYHTYFQVQLTPMREQDALITGLRTGDLHLWVTVYDHTTGEEFPEFRYFSHDPAFDYSLSGCVNIAATGNCPKLEPTHAYSLCIDVKDADGNRRYYGNSELSAFANSTDSVYTTYGGIEAEFYGYTVDTTSPLYGKSVLFIGDSITEASFENAVPGLADIAGWPGRVGYSNGMEWINAGISGATLSGNIPGELEAYAKMGRKFDFIVIHGGVNDAGFGGGKNIGTMSTETVESILADPDLKAVPGGTYASGLEHAIAYAKQHFPEAKICYIMNYRLKTENDAYNKFENPNYAYLPQYFAVGKKICNKWSVPYVDLYNSEKLYTQMDYTTRHAIGDELHVNNIGYDMVVPYITALLKSVATGEPVKATPYEFVDDSAKILDSDVNMALGKPVVNGQGKPLPAATNGKLDNTKTDKQLVLMGRFANNVLSTPNKDCYAQLDLGEIRRIEKINVNLFVHDRANSTYKWEAYTSVDGENWVNVGGKRNFRQDNYYGYAISFAPVSARYVRIQMTLATNEGGNMEVLLNELEVYGAAHTHVKKVVPGEEATCTSKGKTDEVVCSVCGAVLTPAEELPIDPTHHVHVVSIPASEATCGEAGKTAGSRCSDCGKYIVEPKEDPSKPATGEHSWQTLPAVAATCTSKGYKAGHRCTVCGKTEREELAVDPNAHKPVTVPAVAATCTEAGKTAGKQCALCGKVLEEQQTIPPNGHNVTKLPAVAATCAHTGLTEGEKCFSCGAVLKEQTVTPKTPHVEEPIPDAAPTCSEEGHTGGTRCAVCGEIITQPDKVPKTPHVEELIPAQAPTCGASGRTEGRRCVVCGEITVQPTEVGKATELHDYEVVPGSCTPGTPSFNVNADKVGQMRGQNFYHTVKCKICGDTKPEQCKFQMDGVYYGNETDIFDCWPCCKKCGSVMPILAYNDPLPDNYRDISGQEFLQHQNSGCAHKVTLKKFYYSQVAAAFPVGKDLTVVIKGTTATETTPGTTDAQFCLACKTWVNGEPREVPAHAHTLSYTVNGDGTHHAVCTYPGCNYEENLRHVSGDAESPHSGTCAACGAAFTDEHDWQIVPCTVGAAEASGAHTHRCVCTVCGEEKTETAVLTEENAECACGAKYIADQSACTHAETILVTGTPATCTTAGHTSEEVCRTCGKVMTAGETIPATGHRYVCTDLGTTHAMVCSACGDKKPGTEESHRTAANAVYRPASDGKHIGYCDCGKALTAEQAHSGAFTELTETTHTIVCDKCGQTVQTAHSFEKIYVDASRHYRECTVCKLRIYEGHDSKPTPSADDPTHTHATACDCKDPSGEIHADDVEAHSFGAYETTETQHVTACTVCGYRLAEAHSFGAWQFDGTQHWRVCEVCGYEQTHADHAWTAEATTAESHVLTCVCGAVKTEAHHPQAVESAENTELHNYVCADCGYVTASGAHVFGDCEALDEAQHGRTCRVCGAVRKEAHQFASSFDDEKHSTACTVCGLQTASEAHSWTLDESQTDDTRHTLVCSCGAVRAEEHTVVWKQSEDGIGQTHQKVCAVCGRVLSQPEEHTLVRLDNGNGKTHMVKCTVCKQRYMQEHDGTYTDGGEQHLLDCSCGASYSLDHEFTYQDVDESSHARTCAKCDRHDTAPHDVIVTSHDETAHSGFCGSCGRQGLTVAHTMQVESTNPKQHIMRCTGCTYTVKAEHTFVGGVCSVCGYASGQNYYIDGKELTPSADFIAHRNSVESLNGVLIDGNTEAMQTVAGKLNYAVYQATDGSTLQFDRIRLISKWCAPPSFDIFVSDDLVNWVRLTGKTSADADRSFQLNTDTYILDLNVPCTTKYVLFQGTGVRPGFGDKYWPLDKFELYQGETKLKLKEQRSQTISMWMYPCEGPGIELASAQKIKNVAVYTDRPACDFRLVTTSTRSGGELKDYVDFGTLKGTTKVSDGLYMHVFEGSATAKYIIALPTVDMMDEGFASNVKPDVSFRISEIKVYAPLSMTKEEPVSVRVNGEQSATLTDGDRDRVVVPIGTKSAGRFLLTFKEPTRLSEASFYTAADSGALLLLGTADETVTPSTVWRVVGYKQPGQKGAKPGWRDVELDDTVELRHLMVQHYVGRKADYVNDDYVAISEMKLIDGSGRAVTREDIADSRNSSCLSFNLNKLFDSLIDGWMFLQPGGGEAVVEYASGVTDGRLFLYAPASDTVFRVQTSDDGVSWRELGYAAEAEPYNNVFRYSLKARNTGKFLKILPVGYSGSNGGAYEVELYSRPVPEAGAELTTPQSVITNGTNGNQMPGLTDDSNKLYMLPLGENCYIDVDLGDEFEVGKVVVRTYSEHYSFKLMGTTDGVHWTELGNNDDRPMGYSQTTGYTVAVEPGYYSKIRVVAMNGWYEHFSVYNIDVFAPDSTSEETELQPTIALPVTIRNYLADGLMFEYPFSQNKGIGIQRKMVQMPSSNYQAPYFDGTGGAKGTHVSLTEDTGNAEMHSQLVLSLSKGDATAKVIEKTARTDTVRYISLLYQVEQDQLAQSFGLYHGQTQLADGLTMVNGRLAQNGSYYLLDSVRNAPLSVTNDAEKATAFQVKANADGTYSFAMEQKESYTLETLFLTETADGWCAAPWANDETQHFTLKDAQGAEMTWTGTVPLTVASSTGVYAVAQLSAAPGWNIATLALPAQSEKTMDWLSVSAPRTAGTTVRLAAVAGHATQDEALSYANYASCCIWQIFDDGDFHPQTTWQKLNDGYSRAFSKYPELCEGELYRMLNIGNGFLFSMCQNNEMYALTDNPYTLDLSGFPYLVQKDETIDNTLWRSYRVLSGAGSFYFKEDEKNDGTYRSFKTDEYSKQNQSSGRRDMNFYLDKLHGELLSGFVGIGLTEYELNQQTKTPLYTQDTVQKMAAAMKSELEIPEYYDKEFTNVKVDNGSYISTGRPYHVFNETYAFGQKDAALYGYMADGKTARDLPQWLREHFEATKDATLVTDDWASYTAEASQRLLNKSWTEVAGSDPSNTGYAIRNYLDFAYWFMNNLYCDSGISETVPEFSELVFTQVAATDADGNPTTVYVFDGNNGVVNYDVKDEEISNADPNGDDSGVPFLPTMHSGTMNSQEGGANYDFGYTLEGHGKFVFDSQANQYFTFRGDDDVYLFINNKLVLDLGGAHTKAVGRFNLNDYIDDCGLIDGEEYDFDFFYMERHSRVANIRIETNINIVPKEMTTKKGAFEEGKEVPNYGGVNGEKVLDYYFEITNNYSAEDENAISLTDLTFRDESLNVSLSKDAVQLASYGDGIARNVADLTVTITDADGKVVYEKTGMTDDELRSILAAPPADPAKPGLKPGQTFRISGIKYLLTAEQRENMCFRNQVFTSASGIVGTATHTVVTEGTERFFLWKGHALTVSLEDVIDQMSPSIRELISEDGFKVSLSATGSMDGTVELLTRSGGQDRLVDELSVPGSAEAAGDEERYVRFTYSECGMYNAVLTVTPKDTALMNPFRYSVTLMVFNVENDAFVLDYGLPVKLNEGRSALTANDTLTVGSVETSYRLTGMMDGDGVYNTMTGTVDGALSGDKLTPTGGYGYFERTDGNGLTFVSTELMNGITTAQVVLRLSRADGSFTPVETLDIHNEVEMAQNVSIVPASVVYYDDNHGGLNYGTDNEGSTLYQSADQDTPYGSDPQYAGESGANSGGLVHTFTCNEQKVLANFTFRGTGFELVSRAVGKDPALITVTVRENDENGTVVYRSSVYTEYRNNESGEMSGKEFVYQVPVIRKDFDTAGMYYVEIMAVPTTDKSGAYTYAVENGCLIFIQKATDTQQERRWRREKIAGTTDYQYVPLMLDESGAWVTNPNGETLKTAPNIIKTSIYIDGVRIYNPLSAEQAEQYYSDTEKYAKFQELRKLIQKGLIGSASYALNEESGLYELTLGMDAGIFVENRNGKFSGSVGQDVNSYLKAGPNNETYLDGTDGTRALVFYVKADEAMAEQYRTLQLAARLLNRTGLGLDGTQTENPAGDPATLRISTYDAENGFGWDEHRITSATEQYYGIDMSRCYYHPGEDGLVGTGDDLGYQVMIMVSGGALSLTNLKLSGYTLQNVGNVWGDPEHFLAYSGGVSSEVLPDLEPDTEKADAIRRRVQTAMTGIRAAMDIETPEQPVNDLTISGASLTLRSDISMNFYVLEETLNGWENAYMRFAKALYDADGNITGYDEEIVKDYTVKNGCRVYSFNGINASEMSSKVTATLFATQNGKEASSKTVNYSVVTYVKNTLKSSTNAKLNTLLVDMLNYGTEAQRYWSYHLTEPANACLTAEQQAMATSTEPTLVNDKTIVAKEGASVHFKGVALTFREKVAMNVYLNVAGTSENLEAVISYQDRSGTLRSVTVDGSRFVDKRGGVYAVSFDGLDPTQMRTVCSIQVFDRSTGACVSDTLQYSVVSYAKNKQNDAKLGALVMAMIRYGDSAARFFQN